MIRKPKLFLFTQQIWNRKINQNELSAEISTTINIRSSFPPEWYLGVETPLLSRIRPNPSITRTYRTNKSLALNPPSYFNCRP